jgi:transposase
MAVTRTGIPVRVWCRPGNTSDSTLIRQVKTEMREWNLARIVWVADRGFASAENRRFLQRAGGHYILGEKLRAGTADADAALARQGRYAQVADNLQVKEVNIDADDRFVICYNPEAADRDTAVRQRLLAQLTDTIDDSDRLSTTKRAELRGVISTKPGLNRFLRVTPGGLLRIDAAKIKAEQRLDGKYLHAKIPRTLMTTMNHAG